MIHKGPQGWQEYSRLPISPRGDFAIGKRGEVTLVAWDSRDRRLVLWRGLGDQWSGTVIAGPFDEGSPNWWTVRLDPQDRPIVVVGRTEEPHGWLRVLRKTD